MKDTIAKHCHFSCIYDVQSPRVVHAMLIEQKKKKIGGVWMRVCVVLKGRRSYFYLPWKVTGFYPLGWLTGQLFLSVFPTLLYFFSFCRYFLLLYASLKVNIVCWFILLFLYIFILLLWFLFFFSFKLLVDLYLFLLYFYIKLLLFLRFTFVRIYI